MTMNEKQSLLRKSEPRNYFLYFVAISANLTSFVIGTSFTWTSPVFPKLSQDSNLDDNPLGRPITVTETSWITGLVSVGSLTGIVIGGKLTDWLGRRGTLLVMTGPMVASQLIAAFAKTVYLLYLSRLLMGVGRSGTLIALPIYLAEISEDHNRGKVTSLIGIFISLGMLFPYLSGPLLSLKYFCLACVAPLFLFVPICSSCMPESPHFLALKGNTERIGKSLSKLRSKAKDEIEEEIIFISTNVNNRNESKGRFKDLLISTSSRKALKIVLILLMLQAFSGAFAISAYLQTIFIASGTTVGPELASVVVGVAQTVTTILMSFLVDRWGRRFLMILSSIGCFLALTSLGTYFFLKSAEIEVNFISWTPIFSLLLFVFCVNLGITPVPYILLVEMFPTRLKAAASIVCSYSRSFGTFLIGALFPQLAVHAGMAGTFWFFAGICLIDTIITYKMVPETKNKSLREIQTLTRSFDVLLSHTQT